MEDNCQIGAIYHHFWKNWLILKPIFTTVKSKDQIAKNLIREDKQLHDSDIENMITSGRIIETDYGHLFDEIIINLSHEQTQRVSVLNFDNFLLFLIWFFNIFVFETTS